MTLNIESSTRFTTERFLRTKRVCDANAIARIDNKSRERNDHERKKKKFRSQVATGTDCEVRTLVLRYHYQYARQQHYVLDRRDETSSKLAKWWLKTVHQWSVWSVHDESLKRSVGTCAIGLWWHSWLNESTPSRWHQCAAGSSQLCLLAITTEICIIIKHYVYTYTMSVAYDIACVVVSRRHYQCLPDTTNRYDRTRPLDDVTILHSLASRMKRLSPVSCCFDFHDSRRLS